MQVDQELTKKLAKISRLDLTDEEVIEFTESLKSVLDAFSKIQEVDTENTKMSMQPVDIRNITREDTPKESLSSEEALSQTNHKQGNFFKGPKVV